MKHLKLYESYINTYLRVEKKDEELFFYLNNQKIGYVEYYYEGDAISDNVSSSEKEFYISFIKVYDNFKGSKLSYKMLDYVKNYARDLGATIITLRIDYGLGYSAERNKDNYLDKLYLNNGFQYKFSEKECEDDDKSLGAMFYKLY